MDALQTSCNRCGACCMNGGPALHTDDKKLIQDGSIPLGHLITIRKGELVHHPLANRLQAVKQELIKINGAGKQWNCRYYDPEQNGCKIYGHRPQACRVLQCWDTEAIEQLIEKDTLNRLDVIEPDNPIYQEVLKHEALFPCPDLEAIVTSGVDKRSEDLKQLANQEITFRTSLVKQHQLTLGMELFYFGRPLFQLFSSVGARVREVAGRLVIDWPE